VVSDVFSQVRAIAVQRDALACAAATSGDELALAFTPAMRARVDSARRSASCRNWRTHFGARFRGPRASRARIPRASRTLPARTL